MVVVLRYWILLLLGTTCLGHAELSTRLSSDSIEELESVRLVIRDHGAQQTETLDLTELQNNFHIMGNNTSKQYNQAEAIAAAKVITERSMTMVLRNTSAP